jgi:hypothetical protein
LNEETLNAGTIGASQSRMRLGDLVSLASVGVVAYVLSALLHEGLGHGLTCTLVGGKVTLLTSSAVSCDSPSPFASRLVSLAGTVVNLSAGALAAVILNRVQRRDALTFALWFFGAVNAFQGAGYLLVSPLGGWGDYVHVVAGLPNVMAIKLALTALGAILTWVSLRTFGPLLGEFAGSPSAPDRKAQARSLVRVSYLAGGALALLIDSASGTEHLVTSALAIFGGTAPMLAATAFLGDRPTRGRWSPAGAAVPLVIVAVLIAVPFTLTFGRGLHFGPPAALRP